MSNFVKICLVGAELFDADGRTDSHEEANSRFFAVSPKRVTREKKVNAVFS
jgi:hypothetical protein